MKLIKITSALLTTFAFVSASQGSEALKLLGGSNLPGGMHVGYGIGVTEDVEPSSVSYFDKTRNFLMDFDFGRILIIHGGLRFGHDNGTSVAFANGTRRAEIYLSTIHFGLKLQYPSGFFRPFAGGGVMGGYATVSDPTDRDNNHNWGVAFSNEASGVRALYLQGGVDLMVANGAAVRLGYHHQLFDTNDFKNLGGRSLNFDHTMYSAGLVWGNLGE